MTAFKDYMWELLTRPFRKDKSVVVKSYTVITGAMLDDVKACIFRLRRQWLVQTAESEALRMLGDERGIYRYDEEPLEIFRNRVQGAYEMYALGGTLPGMTKALQALGYEHPEITERTPSWSRFRITLPVELGNGFTPDEWQRLRRMVWLMKPAHTMPDYVIRLNPEVQDLTVREETQTVTTVTAKWDFWWLNGTLYRLDGSLRLDGSITLGDGWYDTPIYLDGCILLNGTSLMDGFSRLYEEWRWDNNVMNRAEIRATIESVQSNVNPIYLDGILPLDGTSLLDGFTRMYDEWHWVTDVVKIIKNVHEITFLQEAMIEKDSGEKE